MHTHTASFRFLADWLNTYTDDTLSTVYVNGWPKDPTALDNADCVMIFCDGGGGHIAIPHLGQLRKLMKNGKGIMMFHYALDVPSGENGDFFLDMIGGYFEAFHTIAPFFNAKFKEIPQHPVTRGVRPFSLEDEWYYNIRFRPDMKGIVPLLSCIPPDSTREGEDGYNSGNDAIRAGKGKNQKEIVSWCVERPDGGRGFGYTGGHFHWTWAHPDMRKFILNAIVWTAGAHVPENGIEVPTPTWEELEKNQVYEPNLSEGQIQEWKEKIKQWNR